ncbi:MAG: hypothetical protein WAX89_08255 [Alphaproteobacteria bacterium]
MLNLPPPALHHLNGSGWGNNIRRMIWNHQDKPKKGIVEIALNDHRYFFVPIQHIQFKHGAWDLLCITFYQSVGDIQAAWLMGLNREPKPLDEASANLIWQHP